MNLAEEIEFEIPGKALHQQRARDLAIIKATIAACQAYTKDWFCKPVQIRVNIDEILKGFP